ncbi:MAG TPA: glycogen debranching protein GlgX [Spirochaetota bacterium]|nr:glycogen debranching protein GlgX [Spirochaetota bacterium]
MMGLVHRTSRRLEPGRFYPLGATIRDGGVNFALFSQHAHEVYLLLFDRAEAPPTDVIRLENRTRFIWHVFVPGLSAGQLYGYRMRGEFNPSWGFRYNENRFLLDPYARALTGKCVNADNLLLCYPPNAPGLDLSRDDRDNTSIMPKCIVVSDDFDWQGDTPPEIPFERMIIYETHVRGFTAHPSSGVKYPGTYAGFIEKIPYLKDLGINAVELLPVHESYVDDFLVARGLTNFWGYNTIGFFAPESSFGSGVRPGCQVDEFKALVRALHAAGIEVILDVVYNHTAEGNELGPTMSFRGIDNTVYYILTGVDGHPSRYYMNYSGCGNSLNLSNPPVIRMVLDSLRYWVEVMHVDGFRFDLASVLGREGGAFQSSASFFDAVAQDPVLCRVKLIAEPWDMGTYQVGNFPIDWSEWNGRFRDTVRTFAKGDPGKVREMGWRITGSADLYGDDGRTAYNSINFITCHDGFTLNDLLSYNEKHNEANLENNADGSNENNSWNCGAEGETDDPGIRALRRTLAKNHVCYLLLAQGVPMILGGDECLRTQRGNNNAYCQDNEISWFDWDLTRRNADMRDFVKKAIAFRSRYTILQRRKFLTGQDWDRDGMPDITWYGVDGGPLRWDDPELRTLCYRLDGSEEPSPLGDYALFIVLNADYRPNTVRLPDPIAGSRWLRVIDTDKPAGEDFLEPGREIELSDQGSYCVQPRSTVVLLSLHG